MSVITKDLGAVSAYGLALEAGYEGTEQEYAELLASYGTVAQEAADSAGRAAQAANAAGQILGQTTSARDAAISAKNDAVSAKDTAAEAANVAGRYEAQAESAKTDAESARDTAVNAVDGFAAGAQQALDSVNEAGSNWKSLAEKQAGNSEAWAVGQRGGVDVPTTDATYHNNAKYYAEQASGENTSAQTARQGAETAATNASQSAQDAAASASAAAESARTLTIDATLTQSGQAADAKETGDALAGKVDVKGVGQITPKNIQGVTVSGGNVLEDAERIYCSQPGYVGGGGYVTISNSKAVIANQASFCSFLIPVKSNTHYTANNPIRFAVLLKDLNTSGTSPVMYSTVVGSALANISSFDTGEADHIIVSWSYNTYPIDSFIISEGDTPTTEKTITLPDWWTGGSTPTVVEKPKYASITGSLSSGESLILPLTKNNLRKGERIVFEGNITSFDSLKIGLVHTAPVTDSIGQNVFLIDGTNISYYSRLTNTPVVVPHGVTITDNIQIIWEMTAVATCKITLISDGNIFSHEFSGFVRQTVGFPFVLSIDTVLTDCKLTWTCTDLCKDIWMFGDSYFAYSEARWTYYLHQYGYDNNCLLDGFPGEGGVNGRAAFNNLLQYGTPKFAVWCLGMNDTTDSESAPATAWVTNRDYFLQYCQNNNVTPIFGTIPTVPSINHEQKNAWIRSSGYRYIDFAKAVGASASGVWFSGMLSSDNVHPTPQGARALFARVLLDLPEIMVDGDKQ